MPDVNVGTPEWWLDRLTRKLSNRLRRYNELNDWAVGNHPLPEGDYQYVNALKDLQKKSKTNYVGLAIKATSQRMRVRAFKFEGEVDNQAMEIWKANSMEMQSVMAITDAGKLSDTYTLVSPPDGDSNGLPVITVEDPRQCIVESDPVRPLKAIAGLKAYIDDVIERIVIVLYLPETVYVYHGPHPGEEFDLTRESARITEIGVEGAGYELVDDFPNPLGAVPLIRGVWQPETGLAECEDGGFEVQDRINHTILARLIITKAQAYRQRLLTGVELPKDPNGNTIPLHPGAAALWVVEDENANLTDLDQADIKQVLEAIRDDIGDFAAITQTPVTFLTNRMVNVSGDSLQAAQHSHVGKVRSRMNAMGWYFEQVMKICFRYLGDPKADDIAAEVQWQDPEVHTLAEFAEVAAKYATSNIPLTLVLERLGFTPEEIEEAVREADQKLQEERDHDLAKEKVKGEVMQQRFENQSSSSE